MFQGIYVLVQRLERWYKSGRWQEKFYGQVKIFYGHKGLTNKQEKNGIFKKRNNVHLYYYI